MNKFSIKIRTIKWDYKNKKEVVGHISPTQSTSSSNLKKKKRVEADKTIAAQAEKIQTSLLMLCYINQ